MSETKPDNSITQVRKFGFRYGPVYVQRWCDDERGVLLGLVTKRQVLQIFVTPSGMIRVGKPEKADPANAAQVESGE